MTVNISPPVAETIALDGQATLWLWRGFLPAPMADDLQQQLASELAWAQPTVRVYGRDHPVPRLTAWFGDPGVRYRYSGLEHVASGWPHSLQPVLDRIMKTTGQPFNSALANRYRNGLDTMGYHSDDEPELGPQPWIASLSLGSQRDFVFRRRGSTRQYASIALPHNSLLLMHPAVQQHFEHALPRRKRVSGERINLTFRQVYGRHPQNA